MQRLQILELCRGRIQRGDDSLNGFWRELGLGCLQARHASLRPLHLRQNLLECSCLLDLLGTPDPRHILQQPTIEALTDLGLRGFDPSNQAVALAVGFRIRMTAIA